MEQSSKSAAATCPHCGSEKGSRLTWKAFTEQEFMIRAPRECASCGETFVPRPSRRQCVDTMIGGIVLLAFAVARGVVPTVKILVFEGRVVEGAVGRGLGLAGASFSLHLVTVGWRSMRRSGRDGNA